MRIPEKSVQSVFKEGIKISEDICNFSWTNTYISGDAMHISIGIIIGNAGRII